MSTPVSRSATDEPNTIQVTTAASSPGTANGAAAAGLSRRGARLSGCAGQHRARPVSGRGNRGRSLRLEGKILIQEFLRANPGSHRCNGCVAGLAYLPERTVLPARPRNWDLIVWGTGAAVALFWLMLGWQILLARMGHLYELTNRRLFVNTGFFRRRRDQIELLRVQDVYVKQQGLFYRLLNVGTVVIESSEERLPVHYLAGVSSPKTLMDLIWHHARKERAICAASRWMISERQPRKRAGRRSVDSGTRLVWRVEREWQEIWPRSLSWSLPIVRIRAGRRLFLGSLQPF